ncbi:hypothetical protein Tco_0627361 [Tanacetum coccineum]|uniref:Uncharacterized protein n=1 Tax=Tanacetum coccineum TaxID=301880 RepID=A0ABQ4WMA5_9ASTR
MADSWKAMDLNRFVVKDDMINYVLHKYVSNWQVHDAIADDIFDDLLKREWEKQKRVKYDNRKVIIIESDTSYDYFTSQTTSDEGSDHSPFQATSDESSDHNPFQVTYDESSDDTLKSSSEDTCSSDCTWEQKKLLKNQGLDLPKRKKALKINKGQDEARTIYKGRRGSSFRNAAITKPKKTKSRSKHLAPTTLRTGSTCTTVVVQTKRPPPVTNSILGLAAVTTWQQILNKEFGKKRSKENVGGSSNLRMKGKRKML